MSDGRERLESENARLRRRVAELERVLASCQTATAEGVEREDVVDPAQDLVVEVPESLRAPFVKGNEDVRQYFLHRFFDPARGHLQVGDERYILVRAASMSTEFYDLVHSLYQDQGDRAARQVAFSLLYDVAHALGKADAGVFQRRMGVHDPVDRLSAGPVHFAWTGWARVHILDDSRPAPDDSYFLHFEHEHSFEAESWLRRGGHTDFTVCVMNAGYSSGWCEQAFGIPLVTVETTCRARGDSACRFVMAPPDRIHEYVDVSSGVRDSQPGVAGSGLEVPEFFRRKRLEQELRAARDGLEARVEERTAELHERNEQLRRANERLAETYRAREEFLATVSHELRTPLVTGIGYLELLLAGKLGEVSESARASMKVAFRNLRRLAGLVDDILRYQQLAHPTGPVPALVPADVGALCHEAVEEFLVRTGRARQSVSVVVGAEVPPVLAGREMFSQILANLLNNAHAHAGVDVPVRVHVEAGAGDLVWVHVEDEGPGIDSAVRGRAAEPFVRRGAQGLGLGLAIVQRLVRSHGGELRLESEPGHGTKVSFSLHAAPREAETGEHAAIGRAGRRSRLRPDGARRPVSGVGIHVLVVEDDPDTREYVELVLRQQGCRVTSVATAEEALVALDMQVAHGLLVDYCLPGMSGAELCRSVRGRARNGSPRIAIFTAAGDEVARSACHEAGCDWFWVKPVELDRLKAFVSGIHASIA